jgi:hypothetical protein
MTRSTFAFVVSLSFFGCRYPEAGPAPHAPTREATPGGGPAALDEMDSRTPVPLLPMMANHQKQNMRDHLVAIQEIVQGVATNDFDVIEKAAKRIGYSDEMGQMCTHMGAGAPGFAEQSIRSTVQPIGSPRRPGPRSARRSSPRSARPCKPARRATRSGSSGWSMTSLGGK